jgi:DNA-directed RNA polymerase specialized sigma24 family protein
MLVPELDQRAGYLKECLAEVPKDKREMLTDYYFEDETVDEIAHSQGKSVEATYKALQRVRRTLMHCIEGKMQAGGLNA